MSFPGVGYKFRQGNVQFFDKAQVDREIDAETKKWMSLFGYYVMITARRSMKRKDGPSAPPNAPNAHVGTLKTSILFGYDPDVRNVVIGPEHIGKTGSVPRLLHEGGTLNLRKDISYNKKNAVQRGNDGKFQSGGFTRITMPAGNYRMPARPYMIDAYDEHADNIDWFMRQAVK